MTVVQGSCPDMIFITSASSKSLEEKRPLFIPLQPTTIAFQGTEEGTKILTNHKTFLETAKHITQHQELSKMDINGQLSYYFANKSQLTIPGIYCAISHMYNIATYSLLPFERKKYVQILVVTRSEPTLSPCEHERASGEEKNALKK
ncbi:hypothetical protein P5673_008431 [Acropora cervicornis]|uniref:Uncharacterized protein n=1 Tax=Acropora cervicornis TaxID=6130 RepID=A0AAD9QU45_ACRCE|nr:hypothetical protein P5673_008431 [Acropora cervicornis]